jgi:CTP:molybdopterin cytidylyltransferase MocA
MKAYDSLLGTSIEWRGVHHSENGDFHEISTHTVSYDTDETCYVTAGGKLVGEASYTYKKLDDRMAILIYRPKVYQGQTDVVLYAMLDFENETDNAVILAGDQPFAVAQGSMQEVATPPRPVIPD